MNNSYQTIDSILEKSMGITRQDALKEVSLLIALSKRDKYEMECQKFKRKYKLNFSELERKIHSKKNHEIYEIENDLDDWEFARSSSKWWNQRIEELLDVSK